MAPTREVAVALRLQSQMQEARRDLDDIADRLGKVGQAGRSAGEQTGLDRIGKDAANASRLVDTARERVDRLAQGVQAAASAGSGPSPFIAALREQIALFGKGTEDVLRYRAAQAGVGAESAPLILQLQNMRAAQEAAARAAQEEANAQRQAAAARQAATAQADAFIANLREQVALQGKSNADVLRYRAGTMGLGGQAERYIAEIERFERVGAAGGKTLNRFGVTAGQTAAAMRMLPAQITDITTSIASGMPVWMVAIQQGGQIKDSFGGWRAAGDALLKVFTPLRLVMGAVGVAVGVMVAAAVAGERDVSAFNRAVQTTGNYAGATRGQIEQLAESAASAGGITRGAAREAATAMVQSGRLGMQTIGNLTRVVQDYGAVTGQTTAAAAKSLADMFVKPSEGAEKLNEQFHFLTLEQLRYIRQLEEQGRLEEARLVLSQRFAQHLGGTFVNNLGALESAWLSVSNAVKGAWEWLKRWGTADTLDVQVDAQRKAVAALQQAVEQSRGAIGNRGDQARLAAAQRRLAELEAQRDTEQRDAAAKAERAQVEERRIELDKKLKALSDTLKTNREKIEDEKKLLDEALKLGVIKQGEYDKLLAASREKHRDKKTDQVANAFEQQRLALTQQLAVAQQQLANTVFGVGSSQETATAKLDAWLATSGKAEKLDAARVAELRKLATELDRVAAEQDRVTESAKRRERIDAGMATVAAQFAQATGRSADAAALEIEQRFRQLRKDLVAANDAEGLIKLDKLIDMSKARAQLEDLRRQVDLIFGEQGRQQQTLQSEVQVGLVSELDGRQRLLDIQRNTAQAVEVLLPRMRELAALTGDPQMAAGVADLEARVGTLKLRADELQMAFTSTFGDALKTGLSDLARGTKDLGEAVLGFLLNIAQGMAEFAAQQLAMQATTAVVGALGGGNVAEAAAINAAAVTGASALAAGVQTGSVTGATALAGGIVSATTTGAGTLVAALQGAFTAGAATLATAIASAAAGGQVGSAASSLLSSVPLAFSSGGYTGAGGKYEPAGIVHRGEYVVRAAVVSQPNMRRLLDRINAGMPASLPEWPGFADGGLVMPAARPPGALAAPGQRAMNAQMSVYNYWDMDELVQRLAQHGGFEKAVVNKVSRNGNAIQRSWKS